MPCRSDYMGASDGEIELSKVYYFLEELKTGHLDSGWDHGYHPAVYNRYWTMAQLNEKTTELCSKIQKIKNIKEYSLELQMWWRDHKKVDARHIKEDLARLKHEKDKKALLKRLTQYEKGLLGL